MVNNFYIVIVIGMAINDGAEFAYFMRSLVRPQS